MNFFVYGREYNRIRLRTFFRTVTVMPVTVPEYFSARLPKKSQPYPFIFCKSLVSTKKS